MSIWTKALITICVLTASNFVSLALTGQGYVVAVERSIYQCMAILIFCWSWRKAESESKEQPKVKPAESYQLGSWREPEVRDMNAEIREWAMRGRINERG